MGCNLPNGPAGQNFEAIETYYRDYGIKQLAALDVSYGDGRISLGRSGGLPVVRNSSSDAWLRVAPRVSWDVGNCAATLIFMDIFELTQTPGSKPRSVNIHSIWSDCGRVGGHLDKCGTVVKPYLAPGVSRGPNRYVFVLFAQPKPLKVARRLKTGGWNFAKFLRDNPSLTAVAWNFMSVKGPNFGRMAGRRLAFQHSAFEVHSYAS